jgi:hypothetical protein
MPARLIDAINKKAAEMNKRYGLALNFNDVVRMLLEQGVKRG